MPTIRRDMRRTAGDRYIVRWKYRGEEFKHSCGPEGKRSAEKVAETVEKTVENRLELLNAGQIHFPGAELSHQQRKAFIMNRDNTQPAKKTNGGTLAKLVDDYLAARLLSVESGELSQGSYSSDVYRLENFKTYCGDRSKANLSSIVTADFLGDYKTYQLKRVKDKKASRDDAWHHLRTVKALLTWGYTQEQLDALPRNVVDKKFSAIKKQDPKPQFFTVKQIEKLYRTADERMRLWILLALNCGYLQNDIATLTHDMIDWKVGIIKREREKTGVDSEHRLWPLTLRLLRKQATDAKKQELVLVNPREGGIPWVRQSVNEDGKPSKTDSIGNLFNKLTRSEKVNLPFKCFRKTGADAIEKEYQDWPWLPFLYRSSEITGEIRKHYTGQSRDRLHTATDWLAEYFGFNDGGTLSKLGGSNS